MKAILAAMIAMICSLADAAHSLAADDFSRPKAKRITPLAITLDCQPRRKFCVRKESKNASIHVLRCRAENTASCDLAGERPLEDLSPDAKILKIAPVPDGCLLLTFHGYLTSDHPPSAGR
jgi:hypothetical protein